jgi:hypothetical protein
MIEGKSHGVLRGPGKPRPFCVRKPRMSRQLILLPYQGAAMPLNALVSLIGAEGDKVSFAYIEIA